jgi:hypothetical protein
MMRLDLDGLEAASREALMSEWREVVGGPPPKHLSKPLCLAPYIRPLIFGFSNRVSGAGGRMFNA